MTQEQLIRMVADAAPVADQEVERLDLGRADSELLEEILATMPPADAPDGARRSARPRRRRRTAMLRIGAALAGAAVAGALVLGVIGSGGEDGDRLAFAAEWIEVAERNPRLLVTEPGWEVIRADEYGGQGEMTFSSGGSRLDVHWRSAEDYRSYLRDRSHGNPSTEITLLGRTATMFRYAGSTDFATLLPPDGPTFLEIRGDLGSETAYLDVLRSLEPTDVESWLSAMPRSVVAPRDREAAVARMLEGIPLPPGLDADAIARGGDAVSDRYQLGAEVTGTVACAWLDLWTEARAAGDISGAKRAERAMATSRSWPILIEIRTQGAWSQTIWEYARDIEAGTLVGREYVSGLGCGRYR